MARQFPAFWGQYLGATSLYLDKTPTILVFFDVWRGTSLYLPRYLRGAALKRMTIRSVSGDRTVKLKTTLFLRLDSTWRISAFRQ